MSDQSNLAALEIFCGEKTRTTPVKSNRPYAILGYLITNAKTFIT
jgi:hypothetical protein